MVSPRFLLVIFFIYQYVRLCDTHHTNKSYFCYGQIQFYNYATEGPCQSTSGPKISSGTPQLHCLVIVQLFTGRSSPSHLLVELIRLVIDVGSVTVERYVMVHEKKRPDSQMIGRCYQCLSDISADLYPYLVASDLPITFLCLGRVFTLRLTRTVRSCTMYTRIHLFPYIVQRLNNLLNCPSTANAPILASFKELLRQKL